MRLRVTKSQLYGLVAEYARLPIMKKTRFDKLYRSRSYWLDWIGDDGEHYEAYLTASMGTVTMKIRNCSGENPSDQFIRFEVPELTRRGMIEFSPATTAK